MADRPAFPNCLRNVRERRNLSPESVAKELGTSSSKLAKFEAGEAVPSPRQYETFSAIYGVPDYVLAGETTPALRRVAVDLRQAAATPLNISPRGLRSYFSRLAIVELVDSIAASLQNNPKAKRPAGITTENIVEKSGDIAKILDFDPKLERWIRNPHLAFRFLRAKVEDFGVYCLLVESPPTDYRGLFSRISDRSSLILINKKTFKEKARLFTLVHEFAHFLIGLEGASDPLIINNKAEAACNEFASEFLAPAEFIVELFEEISGRSTDYSRWISYISQRSLLSYGGTAFRLRQMGLITLLQYREWYANNGLSPSYGAEDPPDAEEDATSGGNWAYNVVTDLGFRPLAILKQAMSQQVIDDVHIGHIINARGKTQALAFKTAEDRLAELGL